MEYSYISDISIKSLNEAIIQNDKLILLDFYASWYSPSTETLVILNEIGKNYLDKIKIYRINFDKFRDISEKFEVISLPTIIFIKNGSEKYRLTGTQTKQQFETIISMIL